VYLANKTQKLAARILESHIVHGRVSHAYILSGSGDSPDLAELASERVSSDIKEEFAMVFTAALLGGGKKVFGSENTSIPERIRRRNHPDVRWIGEDREEQSIKIGKDSNDPGTIREIIHWAGLKPYESSRKVCIVLDAERLTEEAANAFLKTLEEPPQHTVFLLLVENRTHLLETIQSRCFEVRIGGAAVLPAHRGVASIDAMPVKEIFDSYPAMQKEQLKRKLENLMLLAREKIEQIISSETPDDSKARIWLEALDLVYDSKMALEANSNQKLMVTRLAMRLSKLFPLTKAAI